MAALSSIEAILEAIAAEPKLCDWNPAEDAQEVAAYTRGGRTILIAGKGTWQNSEAYALIREISEQPGMGLVLVGEASDFDELPSLEGAIPLALPTSVTLLAAALNTAAGGEDAQELQLELERARYESKLLVNIGRALSQERDTERLLDLILLRAREVTGADAGSMYIVENPEDGDRLLRFTQSQNDSREITSNGFTLPVSDSSIVGTCVIKREVINIPNLYDLDPPGQGNNPWGFVHDKSFDEKIDYQTRSLLTIPMISARDEVIGVIQLINKRRIGVTRLDGVNCFDDQVLPFDANCIDYATTLASQACIALENSLLYDEVKDLFEGFVRASVTAIESRDPTTSGHSERVAQLTVGLAKAVDRVDSGPYAATSFDLDEIKQIEYAALLHDFGKVGVREHVLVKPKKLYGHEKEAIDLRFQYIRQNIELQASQKKLSYLLEASAEQVAEELKACDAQAAEKIAEIDDFLNFVFKANEPTVLEQGGFERIAEIAKNQYLDIRGEPRYYLNPDEVISLQVARGSLTQDERQEIESHVVHTYNFLRAIPWGRGFRTVPEVAGAHHEKIDGSGYPRGLKGEEIPAPAKMMTISDIYDALTASDRPYKRAVPVEKALDILQSEVDRGKLDPVLYQMFVDAKIYAPS